MVWVAGARPQRPPLAVAVAPCQFPYANNPDTTRSVGVSYGEYSGGGRASTILARPLAAYWERHLHVIAVHAIAVVRPHSNRSARHVERGVAPVEVVHQGQLRRVLTFATVSPDCNRCARRVINIRCTSPEPASLASFSNQTQKKKPYPTRPPSIRTCTRTHAQRVSHDALAWLGDFSSSQACMRSIYIPDQFIDS